MGSDARSDRWSGYCLVAVALPIAALGGWRFYTSQFGTPDQFLWFEPAQLVQRADLAIESLEGLAAQVGPQGKEKQETEDSLRKLRATRDVLVHDRDAKIPDGRRFEQRIGGLALLIAVMLFGWGFRRLPGGR
jgi:hypothetical protein